MGSIYPFVSKKKIKKDAIIKKPVDDTDHIIFKYKQDFDTNGIFYALGTNFGKEPYKNPATIGKVELKTSAMNTDSKPSYEFIGRNKTRTLTQNLQPSFFSVGFGKYGMKPTHYSLRHYITKATHHLKFWEFQGSNDAINWTCLRKHNDDSSLKGISKSCTWTVDTKEYFSYFRVWVTGATDYGNWNLTCSGMEIYGDWCELMEEKQKEKPEVIAQNIKMERSGFGNIAKLIFSCQSMNGNVDMNADKFKQSLLSQDYPIEYGKTYKNMTINMMKNEKDLPMAIGWINEQTLFEYDENKNGVKCQFIYDQIAPLNELNIGDSFVPQSVFKNKINMALDPDVMAQYKNRENVKQEAIAKYNELNKAKMEMELKMTEQELKKENEAKEKKKQIKKEYDDKMLKVKEAHKFPEWFESLREYAPGQPLQLYAVAWKINKNEQDNHLQRAINWIYDEGPKFMNKRPNEFDPVVALILPPKVEDLTPEQIPDFIVDKEHEFWNKEHAKLSMQDIVDLHAKKEKELKLQKEKTEKKLKSQKIIDDEADAEEKKEAIEALIPNRGKTITTMKAESTVSVPINCIELPPMAGKLKLMQFSKPSAPPPPPFADTKSARKVVRYGFAAMLMHYGVISEAIKCTEYLYKFKRDSTQNKKYDHPQTPQLTLLSRLCASVRYDMFDELEKLMAEEKKKQKNNASVTESNDSKKNKLDVSNSVSILNDDQLKMYLTKLDVDIANK